MIKDKQLVLPEPESKEFIDISITYARLPMDEYMFEIESRTGCLIEGEYSQVIDEDNKQFLDLWRPGYVNNWFKKRASK